jgi:hypothetical protein
VSPASPSPGADALASARAAWSQRQFDAAEVYYKSALDHGGLTPKETLDAYAHLGAARAVLGRRDLARAAFRQAALIDHHFTVPPEGGRKAAVVAAQARKEEAKLGSIRLGAKFPQTVAANTAFTVDATLDGKHAGVTAKIGIDVLDPASGKHWSTDDVASSKTRFEVPADMTQPGATLVLRVDALDPHDNRLASREARVRVEGVAVEAPKPQASAPEPLVFSIPTVSIRAEPPSEASAPAASESAEKADKAEKAEKKKEGGSFWSTPWPYVLGSVALAAGGTAVYLGTRPSDDVSVGAAHVVTR